MNRFILDYTGTVLISTSAIENLWIETNNCSSNILVKCKGRPEEALALFVEEQESKILFSRILRFIVTRRLYRFSGGGKDSLSYFLDLTEEKK